MVMARGQEDQRMGHAAGEIAWKRRHHSGQARVSAVGEGDPRRTVKLRVKATLSKEGVKGSVTLSQAAFMSEVVFDDLQVDLKNLSCVSGV